MAGPQRLRHDGASGTELLRTPPHSVEAEQAVIGGLLLDTAAWDQVGDSVSADDFYRPDHKLIFEAISDLVTETKALDVVTVSEQLDRKGKLADAGGLAYLSTLVRDTPTAANARFIGSAVLCDVVRCPTASVRKLQDAGGLAYLGAGRPAAYAQIVRERALLRSLVSAGNAIATSVFSDEGLSARELVNQAEQRVFEIAERGARRTEGAQAVRTMLPALIDKIDEWHSNPDGMRGVATGFMDFDNKTGGLRGGDLLIVAGRPSMGKTTLAINMAENVALDPNVKGSVLIFSMEMPSEQLMTRMLSSVGGVPMHDIRSGRISDQDWVRITSATSQLAEARIFIDETPGLTPTELRARSRRVKREHGLDMVVVDYLQLMQVAGTKENRATEISEISRGLKALAKELNVPVIALSQLNRSVEQRESKKPVMSDLRESGAIEQDADMILFIYREEVYDKNTPRKGEADIDLAKHRNGETGYFTLTFQGQFTRFQNFMPDAYAEGVLEVKDLRIELADPRRGQRGGAARQPGANPRGGSRRARDGRDQGQCLRPWPGRHRAVASRVPMHSAWRGSRKPWPCAMRGIDAPSYCSKACSTPNSWPMAAHLRFDFVVHESEQLALLEAAPCGQRLGGMAEGRHRNEPAWAFARSSSRTHWRDLLRCLAWWARFAC